MHGNYPNYPYNRSRYFFYNPYPINNNSCQSQAQVMEDNLVSKIRSNNFVSAQAKLDSLKIDAEAIVAQKSSCNSFTTIQFAVPYVRVIR